MAPIQAQETSPFGGSGNGLELGLFGPSLGLNRPIFGDQGLDLGHFDGTWAWIWAFRAYFKLKMGPAG